MGLSRNKVAVSEGAAGSPPFYGESGKNLRMITVFQVDFKKDDKAHKPKCLLETVVQFLEIIVIFKNPIGGVAQLGEHLPCKQGVMGSNPIISTTGSAGPNTRGSERRSQALNRDGENSNDRSQRGRDWGKERTETH